MDERFYLKYKKVLEIIGDVAECAQERLILVGGTALALFHLKHRVSIDLDFVPLEGDDVNLCRQLKGCLSKKGFRTSRGVYSNQFIIQFEDTSIKIEVFHPEHKVKSWIAHVLGNSKLLVASLDDILELKKLSYSDRCEARDLFDIVFILKEKKAGFIEVGKILQKIGSPKNLDELNTIVSESDYGFFKKVISDASKTGD